MKVSLEWLNEFVDIDVSVTELADKLVSAGFEVEEIVYQSANMKNIVLGKIEKIEKIEKADKLKCCQLNIGKNELIQIVTGASNVKEGDLVPVALDTSLLPTGQVIKKGKLMGVESNGMLCSGEELCLTESDYKGASVYGILIMNDEKFPLGTDINIILGNTDTILDIGVTANRPDCNSILGIAREISTILKKPLRMPDTTFDTTSEDVNDNVCVNVIDTDLCPRYMAAAVNDIKIESSTPLMRKRLKAVGLRPINNIVDITNYVLIEVGQPMHSFDKDILKGNKIIVRRAKNEEKITTLDENERILDDSMLAICDINGPVAIAGVMGGLYSGINSNTKNIIFEAAKFMRDNIRRTARTLNLHSDSSFRYERGIDFMSQELGIKRALSLISKNGWGKIAKGIIDKLSVDITPKTIKVKASKVNEILGIVIPINEMSLILNSLQIKTKVENDMLICESPAFRDDIENANDIAEEVIRLYGYDKIDCTLMDKCSQTVGTLTTNQILVEKIKDIAVQKGYSETLTYSFVSPKSFDILNLNKDNPLRNSIKLLNPLGEDMSVMRTNLAYDILNVMASNYIKSIKSCKFFEVAHVYIPTENPQPKEENNIVFACYGEKYDYYTIKELLDHIFLSLNIEPIYTRSAIEYLHLGRSANVSVNGENIGYIGEVNPLVSSRLDVKGRMYISELNLDKLIKLANTTYKFEEISKFPPIERDLAIVVSEEVTASDIITVAKKYGGKSLKAVEIFDVYRSKSLGHDVKSVAINFIFRLNDRTLTDEEVSLKMAKILKSLEENLNAKLR